MEQVHEIDSSTKKDAPAATNGGGRPKRNVARILYKYDKDSSNVIDTVVKKQRPKSKKTVIDEKEALDSKKDDENQIKEVPNERGRKGTMEVGRDLKSDLESTRIIATPPKRKETKFKEITFLDLSHLEVIESKNHKRPTATDDVLENISRSFLETTDLNPPSREESPLPETEKSSLPIQPIKRKLFQANYNYALTPNIIVTGTSIKEPTEPFKSPEMIKEYGRLINPIHVLKARKMLQETQVPGDPVIITPRTSRLIIQNAPERTYSFLESLDDHVPRRLCHLQARVFHEQFNSKKGELGIILYDMYNRLIFDDKLDVTIRWNKKFAKTDGHCHNQRICGNRKASIELSDKVDNFTQLRTTLLHELCHAAAWIFNGSRGHGAEWNAWCNTAIKVFPELPMFKVCYRCEIEYKYTYKCIGCGATSMAHSKSRKADKIQCAYCSSPIEIFFNKKDKDGNLCKTPIQQAAGFAKFVQEEYKNFKKPGICHAEIMQLLVDEFAEQKISPVNGRLP